MDRRSLLKTLSLLPFMPKAFEEASMVKAEEAPIMFPAKDSFWDAPVGYSDFSTMNLSASGYFNSRLK